MHKTTLKNNKSVKTQYSLALFSEVVETFSPNFFDGGKSIRADILHENLSPNSFKEFRTVE